MKCGPFSLDRAQIWPSCDLARTPGITFFIYLLTPGHVQIRLIRIRMYTQMQIEHFPISEQEN